MIAPMPPADYSALLQTGGPIAVLAFFITAFLRGWIVTAKQYDDLRRDRDDWKEAALQSIGGAEKALGLAERRRTDSARGPSSAIP